MFRVVTVTREFGSGGGVIAQSVAGQLGDGNIARLIIGAIERGNQLP